MKILLAFVLFLFSFYAKSENIDLFILCGQSQATGLGIDSCYPKDTIDKDIKFFYSVIFPNDTVVSQDWIEMCPQSSGGIIPYHNFGPEVTFSRNLKRIGYNSAILKVTAPGTSLITQWKKPNEGGIYDFFKKILIESLSKLRKNGDTVTIKGFIWAQGESDSYEYYKVQLYEEYLTCIINDIREFSNNSDLPIMLSLTEVCHWEYINDIANIQKNIAKSNTNITFTDTNGLSFGNIVHLDTKGVLAFGDRLFKAFESIKSNLINQKQK